MDVAIESYNVRQHHYNERPLTKRDDTFDRIIPGARHAMPFGSMASDYPGGEWPTVVYSLSGEPRAISSINFAVSLRFAKKVKRIADNGVALIWTKTYWNIGE